MMLVTGGLRAENPPKLKIVSVEFKGNRAFPENRLLEEMNSKPSAFLRPSYLEENALQDDLRNIILFYNQQGYFQAEIVRHQVDTDTLKQRASILIQLHEGEVTRIGRVGILGNTVFSSELLLQPSALTEGSPFSLYELESLRNEILKKYSEQGYLAAEISSDITIDSLANLASVQLLLQENAQYTIDEVRIEGLQKTHPKVVRRELRFKPGDIVNFAALLDSQRRLYGTGLFRSVFIHPEIAGSGDSTQKDILIELKEENAGEYNIGLSYGTIEKFRGSTELSYSNLFGKGLIAGVEAVVSSRQRSIEPFLTEPWFLGTSLSANLAPGIGYFDEPGFSAQLLGGDLAFGYEFARRSTIELAFQAGLGTLSNFKPALFEGTAFDTLSQEDKDFILANLKGNIDLEGVRLTLVFDKRNNLFNTTRGSYVELSTGYSRSFLEFKLFDIDASNSNDYLRHVAIFKYFQSIHPATTFASAVELGVINNLNGSPETIPPTELFFTGGPNSLRGFEYQKVGPLDADGKPLGGRLKLVWNILEVRRRLYKFIDGLVFVEAGNVWSSPADFKFNDVRSDMGLGIRIFTPIGLARFDYGINMAPRQNEPKGQFWFGLGQAF